MNQATICCDLHIKHSMFSGRLQHPEQKLCPYFRGPSGSTWDCVRDGLSASKNDLSRSSCKSDLYIQQFIQHVRGGSNVWHMSKPKLLQLLTCLRQLTMAQVENNSYCRDVIQSRIRDHLADPGPVLEDVTTTRAVDLPPAQGLVAGFLCQAG